MISHTWSRSDAAAAVGLFVARAIHWAFPLSPVVGSSFEPFGGTSEYLALANLEQRNSTTIDRLVLPPRQILGRRRFWAKFRFVHWRLC